jgi:periplasmic copper chaperone A
MKRTLAALLFLAAVGASPTVALDYKLGDIEIGQPWSRATPPTAPAAGGYLAVTNKGNAPDRLVSVESRAAGRVEIHEMAMEGSVMRMRALDNGVAIPPGLTVELKPGGYHVMFMELKAPFVKDTKVPATLVFEKAGRIDVEFEVAAMGAGPPASHKH